MYVKSQMFAEHGLPLDEKVLSGYNEQDERGYYRLLELRKRGGQDTRKDRPNMYYPFYVDVSTGEVSLEQTEKYTQIALPVKSDGVDGRWRWGCMLLLMFTVNMQQRYLELKNTLKL